MKRQITNMFEALAHFRYSIPGYRAFYAQGDGDTTYERGIGSWDKKERPFFFEIYNTGANPLTIEINDDGISMTVSPNESLGPISMKEGIEKVSVVASGTYRLMLSN